MKKNKEDKDINTINHNQKDNKEADINFYMQKIKFIQNNIYFNFFTKTKMMS